jgi:hypothetical protein
MKWSRDHVLTGSIHIDVLIPHFHGQPPSCAFSWWAKCISSSAFRCIPVHFAHQAPAECICAALRNKDGGQP